MCWTRAHTWLGNRVVLVVFVGGGLFKLVHTAPFTVALQVGGAQTVHRVLWVKDRVLWVRV